MHTHIHWLWLALTGKGKCGFYSKIWNLHTSDESLAFTVKILQLLFLLPLGPDSGCSGGFFSGSLQIQTPYLKFPYLHIASELLSLWHHRHTYSTCLSLFLSDALISCGGSSSSESTPSGGLSPTSSLSQSSSSDPTSLASPITTEEQVNGISNFKSTGSSTMTRQ